MFDAYGCNIITDVIVCFEAQIQDDGDVRIIGFHNNLPVFPHNQTFTPIHANHAYVCDLTFNHRNHRNYFANAIREATDEDIETYYAPIRKNLKIDINVNVEAEDVAKTPVKEETAVKDCISSEPIDIHEKIVRISPHELRSDLLPDGRYLVDIQKDCRKMIISPNKDGRVFCKNNTIQLFGLDRYIPFEGIQELRFRKDEGRFDLLLS